VSENKTGLDAGSIVYQCCGLVDRHNFDANKDPYPALYFNADPDPAFQFNGDPDPASENNADPDPQQHCFQQLFLHHFKTKIICNFVKFVAT
jgi:hypothetical protein